LHGVTTGNSVAAYAGPVLTDGASGHPPYPYSWPDSLRVPGRLSSREKIGTSDPAVVAAGRPPQQSAASDQEGRAGLGAEGDRRRPPAPARPTGKATACAARGLRPAVAGRRWGGLSKGLATGPGACPEHG